MKPLKSFFLATLCCLALTSAAFAKPADPWFNTLVAHWTDYGDPDYLKFIDEAKPDVAQVGFYDCTFYSLAHTPVYNGYPCHLPVRGTKECGDFFEKLNAEIHKRGSRVVGHFNCSFIFGDPAKKTGFFEWYDKGWDEKEMGPKPAADILSMMQVDAAGKPITSDNYKIGGWPEYWACLNNPDWRSVLKSMMGSAIKRGVDGLIANYYYRKDCMCHHCQDGFRAYLKQHYTADELRDKMGIADLATYQFTAIPDWQDPAKVTPYSLAAITWSQIARKQAFDDVWIAYGKKMKPGFLAGQWNHLGDFGQIAGDERCMLPGDLWGKDEDYLWYSTGGAAAETDLAKGKLGEGTLQLRYIRGAFGPGKSFLLGKYEQTRIRVSLAEGWANGGGGMGFYAPFKNEVGRRDFIEYFGYMRRHRELYKDAEPGSALLLLYPRSAVHNGDIKPVDRFRIAGRRLMKAGYAFDVLPDDLLTADRLRGYRSVAYCDEAGLGAPAKAALSGFTGERLAATTDEMTLDATAWMAGKLQRISQTDATPTVIMSIMRQPRERRLLVHLVNYNRQEPPAGVSPQGRGPQDENPTARDNVQVRLQVPTGQHVRAVRLLSPDAGMPGAEAAGKKTNGTPLTFTEKDGVATFTVPKVLVYGMAVVELRR